ncbi:MAG TPA: PAC2 family protein [Natronosporangium sp.]|nr:PAC2 family protein [Natronosporangium sp.]
MTEFDGLPVLRAPVAVAAFEGWNDAADAASAVTEHLEQAWQARPVTALDPEEFYDFQVTRPILTLVEDERHIEWPTTRFSVASPADAQRDVVLIRGIEPSMRWRTYCEQVLEVCHALEVSRIVLLGALLADVPHTRPLPVSGTVSSPEVAERLKLTPTRYEGPLGIVGVLQEACARAELDTVSFWVHVPHYANNPPCPKASLALLHRLEEVLDLPVPLGDLAEEASAWEARVQAAAAQDSELAEYVRELEEREGDAGLHPLSGDEIATEFEKYLRRRGPR